MSTYKQQYLEALVCVALALMSGAAAANSGTVTQL